MSFIALKDLFQLLFTRPSPPSPLPPFANPTYADILLARKSLAALALPAEIVLLILDYAEYWPEHVYTTDWQQSPVKARAMRAASAVPCFRAELYTNELVQKLRATGEVPRVRSVEWVITSQDQGWTSENTHGTYHTSSWLEVSILRRDNGQEDFDPDTLFSSSQQSSSPKDLHETLPAGTELLRRPASAKQGPQDGEGGYAWFIQGNRVAARSDTYCVRWTEGESWGNPWRGNGKGFVGSLREGDWIVVWARAKYAGWECIVEKVEMKVRYGL